MIRKAFVMTLKQGYEEEYERRHNPVWPELQKVLIDHGVLSYSIYLDNHSSRLFAYVEIESEELWGQIAETETCQRWWDYMKGLMSVNQDNSPKSIELQEVFHLSK